jgi:ferredoxin-type protein NapH
MTFRRARTILGFAVVAIIALAGAQGTGLGTFCNMRISTLQFACPIGFLELCVSQQKFLWSLLLPALLGIGLAVIVGRSFCSWICPVAFLTDRVEGLLGRLLPKKINLRRLRLHALYRDKLPRLGYGDGIALLAGGMIGMAVFQYPFFSTFCPIGVVTRNILNVVIHFQVKADLLLLLIPLLAGYVVLGGWNACCAAGVLQSLAGRVSPVPCPTVNLRKCRNCGTCSAVCPAHFCLSAGNYDSSLCTKCYACVDACPHEALSAHIVR